MRGLFLTNIHLLFCIFVAKFELRMKMKKIIILLLACSTLPIQAQYVGTAHRNDEHTEKLLQEVQLLYNERCYNMAEELLGQIQNGDLTQMQQHEVEVLLALIAYQNNPQTASGAIEEYLKHYPDAPEQNRMRALALLSYYAQGDYAKVLGGMQEVDPDMLAGKERDDLILAYALSMIEEERYEEAAVQLGILNLISDCYDNEVAFYTAYTDYKGQRYEAAEQGFAKTQNVAAYHRPSRYYLAEIMLQTKGYVEAEKMAADYIDKFQNDEYTLEMTRVQGEALYAQKRYLQAAVVLEEYLAYAEKPKREALYQLGMSHFNTGEHLRAPELFAMVSDGDDAIAQSAQLHAGLSYLALNDKNKARLCFERAASMTAVPNLRERAMYNYTVCMYETSYSGFGESVSILERFLNEFPRSVYTDRVHSYLVETYMSTKNYEAALQSIAKIQQPSNTILKAKQQLLYKAGTEAFAGGDLKGALSKLNESLKVGDYDRQTGADALFWRGEVYFREGNYRQASRDYAQYLNLTGDRKGRTYGLALYGLGYTHFIQKNYQDAFKQFDRLMLSQSVSLGAVDKATLADAHMRIGDCYFYARKYNAAEEAYNKAVATEPSMADYAVYQKAFTQGLSGRYDDKIGTLTYLIETYPHSDYLDDALYEKGRAYVQLEKSTQAITTFEQLTEQYPQSQYAPIAGNEIALLHYQNDRVRAAIQSYKAVIANYPSSEQAKVAMRDLKSLYVEENMVDSYVEYASQTKGMVAVDVSEHDSLSYKAAEMAYARGDAKAATEGFTKYLSQFPEGAYTTDAQYYLGCIYYKSNNYTQAKDLLSQVTARRTSKYCEEATRMLADLAYNNKDYEFAIETYGSLIAITGNPTTKLHAQVHRLRSAWTISNYEIIVKETAAVLANSKLEPETVTELRYYRAKAYLIQKKNEGAIEDLRILAKDTRNVYGAEAKYQLAQIYYNIRQYDNAEKEVLDYINVSTPHSYWLARSFVLLADVYMKSEKYIEAKQYLISLKQSYQVKDDIAPMIDERLKILENIMNN